MTCEDELVYQGITEHIQSISQRGAMKDSIPQSIDPVGAAFYERIGDLYDQFTGMDDYDRWGDLLEHLAGTWKVPGKILLDVARGTGKSSIQWHRRGYTVTGCDLSQTMLLQAQRKPTADSVTFHVDDMRSLQNFNTGSYDAVTCMDDAVNHVTDDGDLARTFAAAARVLRSDGLYIFDVNNLKAYRTWFGVTTTTQTDDSYFILSGRSGGPDFKSDQVAHAHLTVFTRDCGHWNRRDAVWIQRHYPVDRIEEAMLSCGLHLMASYGLDAGKLQSPADEEEHNKTIYVARRI